MIIPASGRCASVQTSSESWWPSKSFFVARFDPADQMTRYLRLWREGYFSATGECFDIGNTVGAALSRFLSTGDPWWAPPTHTRPATAP